MGGGCRLGFARTCARGLSVVLRAGARRNIEFIQKQKTISSTCFFLFIHSFYATIS